jgi:endonuclease YncB( thermonuclease family)
MTFLLACTMLVAVDGDTIRCSGDLMRILGDGTPYESGVDAPETRGNECRAEAMLGQLAKNRLQELLETPGLVIEDSGEIDRFERPLVTLRLPDGQTAGQVLIDEGLAVEWTPEYVASWCG